MVSSSVSAVGFGSGELDSGSELGSAFFSTGYDWSTSFSIGVPIMCPSLEKAIMKDAQQDKENDDIVCYNDSKQSFQEDICAIYIDTNAQR